MERWELEQAQALPLELKIEKTKARIREWHEHWRGRAHVSFSGGKDSTVLLHLAREIYPNIPAVFCDTGLEYPEIREFVRTWDNVTVIRPKMSFRDVLLKYGYPVVSKEQSKFIYQVRHTKSARLLDELLNGRVLADGTRGGFGRLSKKWRYLLNAPFEISLYCCEVLKKNPFKAYEKETESWSISGEMADEGRRRKSNYLLYGCNGFAMRRPRSRPLSFWTEQDILRYLKTRNVPYASIYGNIAGEGKLRMTGMTRTGCIFCMFGVHLEGNDNRFMKMKRTHPKQWDYCVHTLGLGRVLDYIGVPYISMFDEDGAE